MRPREHSPGFVIPRGPKCSPRGGSTSLGHKQCVPASPHVPAFKLGMETGCLRVKGLDVMARDRDPLCSAPCALGSLLTPTHAEGPRDQAHRWPCSGTMAPKAGVIPSISTSEAQLPTALLGSGSQTAQLAKPSGLLSFLCASLDCL